MSAAPGDGAPLRNELYVISLLEASDRARDKAASVLGIVGLPEQLARLRDPTSSRQEQQRVFDLLAREMEEVFTPPELSDVAFTEDHLLRLANRNTRNALASLLGCDPNQALLYLLSAERMADTLERNLPSGGSQELDVESLLLELCSGDAYQRLRISEGFGIRGWGRFMERRRWLRPSALERLQAEAARRGWSGRSGPLSPTQVLSAIVDGLFTPAWEGQHERTLDMIGLLVLRQRIARLVAELRQEALKQAEQAAAGAPALQTVQRLPGWIQIYERQAPRSGLGRLFRGERALRSILPRGSWRDLNRTGSPDNEKHLVVRNLRVFTKQGGGGRSIFGRRQPAPAQTSMTFEVHCHTAEQGGEELILECVDLPAPIAEPVVEAIKRLRGRDLAFEGSTLGARLLNTEVVLLEGAIGYLQAALRAADGEIAQCMVLCHDRQLLSAPIAWRDRLPGNPRLRDRRSRRGRGLPCGPGRARRRAAA